MIKDLLNSFCIAFSMYSRIPMPNCEWSEKNMKYSMCFFPLVGAVIALLMLLWHKLAYVIGIGKILIAAISIILPILVTGGIHIDGYIDTVDALNSYKSQEEKLKIMKDPHIGAFALIKTIAYIIVHFAVWTELSEKNLEIAAMSFVVSRALSSISVVNFKCTATSSLAKQFSNSSDKKIVTIVMILYLIIAEIIMSIINIYIAVGVILTALIVFIYYRHIVYKNLGGITGDTSGYFLQICELFEVLAVVILEKIFC